MKFNDYCVEVFIPNNPKWSQRLQTYVEARTTEKAKKAAIKNFTELGLFCEKATVKQIDSIPGDCSYVNEDGFLMYSRIDQKRQKEV